MGSEGPSRDLGVMWAVEGLAHGRIREPESI